MGYISKLQNSMVQFLSNGKTKTKVAFLAFLYCEEFAKTPSSLFFWLNYFVRACMIVGKITMKW